MTTEKKETRINEVGKQAEKSIREHFQKTPRKVDVKQGIIVVQELPEGDGCFVTYEYLLESYIYLLHKNMPPRLDIYINEIKGFVTKIHKCGIVVAIHML